MYAIEIRNLTKRYGRKTALDKLSLVVTPGAALGLIGPIGAGKTTLLRILATALKPNSGDVFIDGLAIAQHPQQIRQIVGYMPSTLGGGADMTAQEYLTFYAACYAVPENDRANLSADLLQLVDLYHRRNEAVDKLSPGMRKRLELARTLVHDPAIMLLDEPFTGLDPRARVETNALINELRSLGKTIVVTSPSLNEVEPICSHIAFIHEGKLSFSGGLDEVQAHFTNHQHPQRVISIRFLGDPDRALSIIKESPDVSNAQPVQPYAAALAASTLPAHTTLNLLKEIHIAFNGDYNAASQLLRNLMHSGTQVVSFTELANTPNIQQTPQEVMV